jgi:hypothetical protein
MPSYFRDSRNVELSTLYYLEQCFASDWSGITCLKTFADVYSKDQTLPIVCVRLASTTSTYLELGDGTLLNHYLIIIDLFCRSDAQRLDLSDYIKSKLSAGWTHYAHSHASGDNTTLERTADGRDYVRTWTTDSKIDIPGSTDEKDRYRHNISILVRKSS